MARKQYESALKRVACVTFALIVTACGEAGDEDGNEGLPGAGGGSPGVSGNGGAGQAGAMLGGASGAGASQAGGGSASGGGGGGPTSGGVGGSSGSSGSHTGGSSGSGGSMVVGHDCRDETYLAKTYSVCPLAALDYAAARAYCQLQNRELLQLDDAAEELWAYEVVAEPGSIWLGATDALVEGTWRWPDGSALDAYLNWDDGQPNDSGGGEDCAVLHSGMGRWNDVPCNSTAFGNDPLTTICEP